MPSRPPRRPTLHTVAPAAAPRQTRGCIVECIEGSATPRQTLRVSRWSHHAAGTTPDAQGLAANLTAAPAKRLRQRGLLQAIEQRRGADGRPGRRPGLPARSSRPGGHRRRAGRDLSAQVAVTSPTRPPRTQSAGRARSSTGRAGDRAPGLRQCLGAGSYSIVTSTAQEPLLFSPNANLTLSPISGFASSGARIELK